MFFFLSPVSHAALKLIDGFISGERPEDKRIIQIKFYFPMKWTKFWVRGWINEMEKGTTKESSIMAEISPHQEKKMRCWLELEFKLIHQSHLPM